MTGARTTATIRPAGGCESPCAMFGRWASFAPRMASKRPRMVCMLSDSTRCDHDERDQKNHRAHSCGAMVLAVPPTFPRRPLTRGRGSTSDGSPRSPMGHRGVAITWAWITAPTPPTPTPWHLADEGRFGAGTPGSIRPLLSGAGLSPTPALWSPAVRCTRPDPRHIYAREQIRRYAAADRCVNEPRATHPRLPVASTDRGPCAPDPSVEAI